jgi:hypothetical protein
MRAPRLMSAALVATSVLMSGCNGDDSVLPASDELGIGTWGGENAGVMVDDTIAHVHVGCTFGNFGAPVNLDAGGRFTVAGSYILKAYPVFVGPSHPAQFSGRVQGDKLTISVTVSDTVEKKQVVLGPVTVTFGRDPRMGPCPICRPSAMRASKRQLQP